MGAPQRNVYGPDGVLLIEDAEYTQETEALRDLGFIDQPWPALRGCFSPATHEVVFLRPES